MMTIRDNELISDQTKLVHEMEINDTFKFLETKITGLPEQDIDILREKYGWNEIQTQDRRSRAKMFSEQFLNPITYVLLAAGILSLLVGKLTNFIVIVAIVLINGIIGFIQEVKAENALDSLKSMTAPEATILRDCGNVLHCTQYRIKAREIVPGDIIYLEAGDKIPADARLFEVANLQVDEALLTGESLPVRKITTPVLSGASVADRKNLVFSGTTVVSGRGKAIVYAIGMKTQVGKIAELINQTKEMKSPLEKRVSSLSKKLGVIAFFASALTFILGIIRGFDILDMLIFASATLVSSIPSGLPATITITLAIGVSRMVKRNAIIRKLNAIDSLGAVTTIVSDKTGTLTQNQMTVKHIFVDNTDIEVGGVGYIPIGDFTVDGEIISITQHSTLPLILQNMALSNDAILRQHELENDEFVWEIVGDPTEGALLVAALKAQFNKLELMGEYPRIDEIPFESANKYMLTIHKNDANSLLIVKGAPEVIMQVSKSITVDGQKIAFDDKLKDQIEQKAEYYASEGYRVLGIAYHEESNSNITTDDLKAKFESRELEMIFMGLIAIIDPPREEVKEAILRAHNAGIKVIMATGDHKLTASSIGKDIGILTTEFTAMDGKEIDSTSESEFIEKLDTNRVFARVSPEHKYRIVNGLKSKGEIVAMTGDGANDAPALKTADVGVAMGITGTDVTKDAASMILTDDNFASIVNAVEEGRVVYENIKKGVKFLLTTNMGEVITILVSMLLINSEALIFTPIMILWVNLVTDGSLTVALAAEPRENDVMLRPPKKPEDSLIDRSIIANILLVASVMAAGVIFIFNVYSKDDSIVRKETLSFTVLAVLQIFNAIASRSNRESIFKIGFRNNRMILFGLIASFGLQILAVHLSFFNLILETTPLLFIDWVVILGIGSTILIVEEVRKYFLRRKEKLVLMK
ncbi:cation-translocating P-type ATPase [Candidatus Lokiarchaeum ossiferum]